MPAFGRVSRGHDHPRLMREVTLSLSVSGHAQSMNTDDNRRT